MPAGSVSGYWSDLGCRKTIYHSLINLHGIAADPKYKALGRKLVQDTFAKQLIRRHIFSMAVLTPK